MTKDQYLSIIYMQNMQKGQCWVKWWQMIRCGDPKREQLKKEEAAFSKKKVPFFQTHKLKSKNYLLAKMAIQTDSNHVPLI